MAVQEEMPSHLDFMNPVLEALETLGGSGTSREIYEEVVKIVEVPDEMLEIPHEAGKGNTTEIQYRLFWTRRYLKHYGLLQNSTRGVWALVRSKQRSKRVNPQAVGKAVQKKLKSSSTGTSKARERQSDHSGMPEEKHDTWRAELQDILINKIDPVAFERLCQRVLRESGFVKVEVSRRDTDGGFGGRGVVRLGELLSFRVSFQCVRTQGNITAGAFRDFRAFITGPDDRALFVTTGSFSRNAMKEAMLETSSPMDLIDGEQLANRLRRLSLGVSAKYGKQVVIDRRWFKNI